MRKTGSKTATATRAPLAEMSRGDRDVLVEAYKSGLISGWKSDPEHGYRLTLADARDEYVEIAKLTTYLEGLRKKLR
jgi:hypothetical protein